MAKVVSRSYLEKVRFIFIGETHNALLKLFRYTFVGGTAFIADFGTLYFLTEYFKIHYLISAVIAFVIGLLINYFLSVKWVFNSKSNNQDHSMLTAMTAVNNIISGHHSKENIWNINTEEEYHEEK